MASSSFTSSHSLHVVDLDEDYEDFEFAYVQLQLSRASSPIHVTDGISKRIKIGIVGVVTMEDTPVLDLQEALTELGVPAIRHAYLIACLLEHVHNKIMNEGVSSPPTMVVMDIIIQEDEEEEVAASANGQMPTETVDFLCQVERLRLLSRGWLSGQDLDNNSVEIDDFDAAVTRSIESDYTIDMPTSEEAIDRLEKIEAADDLDLYCAVCMEYDEGESEEFARMPCEHVFHKECVVSWLRIRDSCPLCRVHLPS